MANVGAWVWSGNAAKLLADNILVGATTVSATELSYLDGATSNIQTQLDGKQPTISLTGNRALATSAGGGLQVSITTRAELDFLSGATSNVQTQLNAKLNLSGGTLTGALTINTASNQLVLGSGVNALTVNGGTSAAARTYTVPDVGTTADFVMTEGTQTIAGAKTFSALTTIGAQVTSASPTVHVLNGLIKHGVPASSVNTAFVGRVSLSTNYYESGAAESDKWSSLKSGASIGLLPRVNATDACFIVSVSPIGATPTPLTAIAATSQGNVGIGTSSPDKGVLHINTSSGTTTFAMQSASGADSRIAFFEGTNATPNFDIIYAGSAGTGTNNRFRMRASSDSASEPSVIFLEATQAGAVTLGPSGAGSLSHVINGSNVTQQSATFAQHQIDSAGGTDALLLFSESGGTAGQWAIGKDNSNSDALDISAGGTLGSNSVGIITRAGAWTWGPNVGTSRTDSGPIMIVNGPIQAGGTGTGDANQIVLLNANAYTGATNPVRQTGLGGAALYIHGRTTNTFSAFNFVTNQAADSATTSASSVGSIGQSGAWTLGPTTGTATHNFRSPAVTTARTGGAAAALPANPVAYMEVQVQGSTRYIPYYS